MLYTSSSLALAVLEILVHVKRDQIPIDYVWLAADIPSELIEHATDVPPDPAQYGSAWLEKRGGKVALAVPSVIIPEINVLLNPDHTDFIKIRWTDPVALALDPRLTQVSEAESTIRKMRVAG